jgi:hypothetical protein
MRPWRFIAKDGEVVGLYRLLGWLPGHSNIRKWGTKIELNLLLICRTGNLWPLKV